MGSNYFYIESFPFPYPFPFPFKPPCWFIVYVKTLEKVEELSPKEQLPFVRTLHAWLCCLPGMAFLYPYELGRLRIMLDFNEPSEKVATKIDDQFGKLHDGPKGFRELWHGVLSHMAHHTVFGLAMLWPYTIFDPQSPLPAMLGYLSIGLFAYPVSTLHTRVAFEAGVKEKKYTGAIDCLL